MPDHTPRQNESVPNEMQTRYRDMGDGTHAQVTAVEVIGAEEGIIVPVELVVNVQGSSGSNPGPQALLSDEITGALATISTVHHEIHDGDTFQSSWKSPDASPIADNAVATMLLTTGARYPHLTFEIAAGGDAEVRLYKNPTVTDVGTVNPSHNMNDGSSKTATAMVTMAPTVTDVGEQKHICFLPGGTGGNSPGGTARQETEWILDIDSSYMIQATNRSGIAQPIGIVAQWYEEETN